MPVSANYLFSVLCRVMDCPVEHDTNGHAFIKVPCRSMFDLGAIIGNIVRDPGNREFSLVPEVKPEPKPVEPEPPEYKPCPDCNGAGNTYSVGSQGYTTCAHCDGCGKICYINPKAPVTFGPTAKCSVCEGTGHVDRMTHNESGGRTRKVLTCRTCRGKGAL